MNDMKFSVLMSVYQKDDPQWFQTAIESVLNQSVKPNEIVLVIDGPIPELLNKTVSALEKDPLFKVVRLEKNVGLGNALAEGLKHCSHELVARMDSDDLSLPSRFEEQIRLFKENPALDIVGGDISEFIGDETNIVAYRKVPQSNQAIQAYLKKRCPLNHVSVIFKKSAVQAAGGYLDLFWNEDYYLWIRMAEHGAIMANTGTVLVNVRTGSDMYQRRGGKKYFESEKFLQDYMLERKMINRKTYLENVLKRWVVQRALPNRLRGWVFRTFARKDD